MADMSRGNCITAYSPAFAKGAKVYSAQLSGILTGVASAGIVAQYIGSGAVTQEKIGSAAVTKEKIAANAVRKEKISAGAVTSAKIGVSAVGNTNIKANAVRAGAISAKAVTSAKLKAFFSSGSIVSGGVTFAVAHGLGAKPKVVIVNPLLTAAQRASATILRVVHEEVVSASTSTNIYIRGNQAGNTAIKYSVIAFG